MTKKTKKRGLPILACILLVLAGSYVGLTKYLQVQEEEREAQESREEESSRRYVSQMEDITSIRYENGEIVMEFSKEEEQWVVTELPDFPLTQSYPEAIAAQLSSLEATRTFESPDALSDYGLENPSVLVTAEDGEGNRVTICVGNAYDSEYYAYVESDPSTVYTIGSDLVEDTAYELYDMIELEEYPSLSEEEIVSVELTLPQGTFLIEKEIREVEPSEDESTAQAEEESTAQAEEESTAQAEEESTAQTEEPETETIWYVSANGQSRQEMQTEAIEELLSILTAISIEDCVTYKADETQMEAYGLGGDAVILTVTYETGEESEAEESTAVSVLSIGLLDEENEAYYVRLDDSTAVNRVAQSSLSGLMSLDFSEE